MHPDIGGCRPHRLTDADLARAFGDADQHDVHDADTTYEQGYPRHPAKQVAESRRGGFLGLDDVLLRANDKIGLFQGNVMPLS